MEDSPKEDLEKRKQKIKDFFNEHFAVIALMSLVTIVYLYYFFKLGNQPIWWDEGDYLSIAHIWFSGMNPPEWWSHVLGQRPLFIPLIWSLFFRLGLGEASLRFFTELLPALGTIFLTYYLGKELFNKKVGLIAMSFISFNWVFMFYSFRLLMDAPSVFFGMMALTSFWVFYEKRKNKWGLWFAVMFGVFSFLARYTSALVLVSIAIYLLLTRKFNLLKDKNVWIAGIIGLLFLSPFFAYNYSANGNIFPALGMYHGSESTAVVRELGWSTVTDQLPIFLTKIPLLLFIMGLIISMQFFLYIDLILTKNKKQGLNYLFLFIISVILPLYLIFGIKVADARYYMTFSPQMFICAALAVSFVGDKIKPFLPDKKYVNLLIIIFCVFIMYNQLGYANNFIMNRFGSYGEVKEAGLWLKENTPKDAKIITSSIVQNQYYSQRDSSTFQTNASIWSDCSASIDGGLSSNESCQRLTEEDFNKKVTREKPDYAIVNVFEPMITPQWAFTYPQRYNMTPVAAFGPQNQPMAMIYKFNY